MNRALEGTTTLDQSRPGSNGNEGLYYILQDNLDEYRGFCINEKKITLKFNYNP